MKLGAVVVIVAFAMSGACGGNAKPAADASAGVGGSGVDIPVGDTCDAQASYFCAQYAGLCVGSVCRQQCAETYPRCPPGTRETHLDATLGPPCLCIPE